MKGLFPQYKDSADKNYADIWKNALFIFDTNVLLNFYRYQAGARDELLTVLGQLVNRIWIPHHVALEFQRNRLMVIAEQGRRFSEVRRVVEKSRAGLFADFEKLQLHKRHSLINPESLFSGFEKLVDEFISELSRLQESQQKLNEPDPLRAKIEALFDGKVGSPPMNQDEVDGLYKDAEQRYKLKIPPGYQDAVKDKDESDEYVHGGVVYKRKYGDYLVWSQLLDHAKSSGASTIIFVTDDGKEDWWQKIDFDGPKTIGPRPELIEEAHARGKIENLLMYHPEGFLKFAKEFLKAQVSEETLKEVRDVSTGANLRNANFREFRELASRVERGVMQWLLSRFSSVQSNRLDFPDFVVKEDGKLFGFEVKMVPNPKMVISRLREVVYRAYYALKESGFAELAIVWVANSSSEADALRHVLLRAAREEMPSNLRMIVGVFNYSSDSESEFLPSYEFAYGESESF